MRPALPSSALPSKRSFSWTFAAVFSLGAILYPWALALPGAAGRPIYASSGTSYPDLAAQPGNVALKHGSPGHRGAERIPNFNDQYAQPDVGAHQSDTPPMQFGSEWIKSRAAAAAWR